MKYAIFILGMFFMSSAHAANQWREGEVSNIRLNTDYNNNKIGYTVGGVFAMLNDQYWSVEMEEKVLSVMLAAQMAGKKIRYWGNGDCKLIQNRLSIDAE